MRGWRSRIFRWILRRFVAVLGTSAGVAATGTLGLLVILGGVLWRHCGGPDLVDTICRDAGYGKCGDGGEVGALLDPSGTGYYGGVSGIGNGAAYGGAPGQLAGYCDGGLGATGVPCAIDASTSIPTTCSGSSGPVCTFSTTATTSDGGVVPAITMQLPEGVTYYALSIEGHASCPANGIASTDSTVYRFDFSGTTQTDGGGAVIQPGAPAPSFGPLTNVGGSAYGDPSPTLDASAGGWLTIPVQGVADAGTGCVIKWNVGGTLWIAP